MIIDKILDRRDGTMIDKLLEGGKVVTTTLYRPERFYREIQCYGQAAWPILEALDEGEEVDVKKALCDYITENDYNIEICDYINSVDWICIAN